MKKIFLVPLLFFVFSNNGVAETLKADCICVHDGYVNAHFYERPKEHSVIIGDKSNGDILKIGDVVKIKEGPFKDFDGVVDERLEGLGFEIIVIPEKKVKVSPASQREQLPEIGEQKTEEQEEESILDIEEETKSL